MSRRVLEIEALEARFVTTADRSASHDEFSLVVNRPHPKNWDTSGSWGRTSWRDDTILAIDDLRPSCRLLLDELKDRFGLRFSIDDTFSDDYLEGGLGRSPVGTVSGLSVHAPAAEATRSRLRGYPTS